MAMGLPSVNLGRSGMRRAPPIPPWRSLRFRVTAAVSVILILAMGVLFALQYRWFHREMMERLGLSSTPLSDVIKGSLRHAMQTRNPSEAEAIVDNVSRQPSVVKVWVLDKTGEIRVSPDRSEVGTRIALSDETCQLCHREPPSSRARTAVFTVGGERVFRNVNPIFNEPACHGCHDPRQAINGVLITDFSMAEIDRQLAGKLRGMLAALVAAVGVAGIVIMLTMNRLVVGRLERLVVGTRALGQGRLDSQVEVGARDEIGVLAASFNDMVESLRRAREVREHKELLENVLNHVADAVVVFAPDGAVVVLNRGAERTFGLESREILGRREPLLGEDHDALLAQAQAAGLVATERRLRGGDGRYFPARAHVMALRNEEGGVLACLVVAQDLTEEKVKERLQEQLLHTERLAAMGRLAAGVAHEMNNPLGNILLHSKLLLEDEALAEPARGSAQRIVDNTLRCKAIVRSLLDYARQSSTDMEWADVNELVRQAVGLVHHEMESHRIGCDLVLDEHLPRVRCDARQIAQILVNLLQNAIEAVDGTGGRVEVRTERAATDGVVLRVTDDGRGIPADAVSRVFEPFYTTKPHGTGLGLAICYGIVERHHGRIWAESGRPDGEGAAFVVELPSGG
jgi:PAS domain S-box-containing protein